jgi:hypothetical protein
MVRASLPADYAIYVEGFDPWFKYVENYRHALAHRIPLYIPSRQYTPEDAEQHGRLDKLLWEAIRAHRFDEVEELEGAIQRLGSFHPFMMHSFTEPSQPMAVHPQMLCDLATVLDLTERLLPHLDGEE